MQGETTRFHGEEITTGTTLRTSTRHTGTGRRERGTRVSDQTLIGVSPDKPEQKPDQRSRRQLKRRSESIEKIVFATEGEFQRPTTNLDSIDYPTRTSGAFND
ncbi:unnamed protein product [Brassica rapa]|uniref:Uncharacterized protein n=1 Tax=Brassica campestris TaxID=3711 RepID=A0A8D9D7U0_BRACM|nr:unnamed protein product [Brassica rapa]